MPELTLRQAFALENLVRTAQDDYDVEIRDRTDLIIHYEPESRPGRGHDIVVAYINGDNVISDRIDVYGHGNPYIGRVEWIHEGSECENEDCTPCQKELADA
jgi:hypothetical protein